MGSPPSREILSGWIREVNRTLLLPEKTEEEQDKRFVSSLLRLNSIIKNGINTLEIEYEWPEAPMQVKLDKNSKKKFETLLLPPNIDTFAVEDVVLEADFHAAFVNFTLYRTDGSPIRCIASQDDASTVMDSLMHYVKVRGDARRNRVGEILDFAVRNIEIEGEASLTDFDMGKVVETCWKHGVAPVNFRKWRERFLVPFSTQQLCAKWATTKTPKRQHLPQNAL